MDSGWRSGGEGDVRRRERDTVGRVGKEGRRGTVVVRMPSVVLLCDSTKQSVRMEY